MAFYARRPARRSYGTRARSGYATPRGRVTRSRGSYRGRARASRTAATIVIQAPYGSMPMRVRAGQYRRPMYRRRY